MWALAIAALIGSFVLPASASSLPTGCVDLLTDCNPSSGSLEIVCGFASHVLVPPVSDHISFVVFGPGIESVTLVQCGTGLTTAITGDTSLCELSGSWNDNVCEILIRPATPAPSLSRAGLSFLVLALLTGGILALRRQVKPD